MFYDRFKQLCDEKGVSCNKATLDVGLSNATHAPVISPEDGHVHVLRGLISYHERMTMGAYPERDFYLDTLRYALKAVEEKIEREAQ